MKIIVGLGNPGEKYTLTRHNIGFTLADLLAEKYARTAWSEKFHGIYSKCFFENEKFFILKPTTFMNNSGISVKAITDFYKVKSSDVIIIHDDLDLQIGQVKVKLSGGHAGHNGLKSIHQAIGNEYTRIRIGIGRPIEKKQVSTFVLSNFTSEENSYLEYKKKAIVSNIAKLLSDDYDFFTRALAHEIKEKKHATAVRSKPMNNPSEDNKSSKFFASIIKKFH